MPPEEIKARIRELPRQEVGPLLRWLQDHFDRELREGPAAADLAPLDGAICIRLFLPRMGRAGAPRKTASRIPGGPGLAPKNGSDGP